MTKNICLVCTNDSGGGAALACIRLAKALIKNKQKVTVLVQSKSTNSEIVVSTTNTALKKWLNLFRFAYERLIFRFYEKSKDVRFAFSIANTGEDISQHPSIIQADIIHLHWVNFGFLSLKSLSQLIKTKKPIVWTLHDMWSFTGGCHYNKNCYNYTRNCGNCLYLKHPNSKDLSYKHFQNKKKLYKNSDNISFVTCSNWLATEAKKSELINSYPIKNIANPINTDLFRQISKTSACDKLNFSKNKFTLLFGAASLKDKRKGLDYFIKALHILKNKTNKNDIQIAIFGKENRDFVELLPFKTINLGYIKKQDDLVSMYSASDVYITTSIQDNLPNTIMESLSCSLPVIAFDIGGIPEMIDHKKNGYLAKEKSSEDIAEGIIWLMHSDIKKIKQNARNKVLENFSEDKIFNQYNAVYNRYKKQQMKH